MSQKNLLSAVRFFCLAQFIIVLLWVLRQGVSKTEMAYVLISAIFGILVDGFFQTILKAHLIHEEKRRLDIELDQLTKDFSQEISKDKK